MFNENKDTNSILETIENQYAVDYKLSTKDRIKVDSITLDSFSNEKKIENLDVEGHELKTLHGIDFSVFSTKLFVIETMQGQHQHYKEIQELLNKNGYIPVLENFVNTFFINKNFYNEDKNNKIIKKIKGYYNIS